MTNKSRKPRIFYLAWTPPTTNGGACLAMHRHFVLRDDFDVFVASSSPFQNLKIPSLHLQRHPAMIRLSNTRFCRLVRQFEMTVEPYWFLRQVESSLHKFRPDVIFTVPDNTLSWTAYLLAKKTGLPFITNFQDWWPKGQFTLPLEKPYLPVRSLLEHRFHRMYEASEIAFCTSAGMKQKLGAHSNAPVLYPCPAPRDLKFQPDFKTPSPEKPLRLIYAGTIIDAYGRSVLSLAKALRSKKEFEFHVYGPHPDWPEEDRAWMEAEGVYRGLVPHEELKVKLYEADVCLVVMSSEPQLRMMMETSFTTKFLEYSQYGKPIVVWGPEYCQPVQVANTLQAGVSVTSPKAEAVIDTLYNLREIPHWKKLAEGAWNAANNIFDPDQIHSILNRSIRVLLEHESVETYEGS
ncbi:MAG: glycosyltransferase [Cyanobacteria bacterium J06560_6]